MPKTEILFYQDDSGHVPCQEWLKQVYQSDKKAASNLLERMKQLAELGHELRRPTADYLRDGIYELRARRGRVQYRLLYFFDSNARHIAILTHGLIKEDHAVPPGDIDLAIHCRRAYERDRERHTCME